MARTALLGLVGSSAIVVGAVLGGQSFETHLPGAWFFGMPGGPFGSFGSDSSLPTIASLALVFGGLILLSRVWFGFLRHLNSHHGFPVKRVVLVVTIWAIPLLLAPPLFSRDVYTYSAQGEMMSHHINPYSYGPEVLGATPFNQDGRHGVVRHRIALRPDLPERRTACSTRLRATRSCPTSSCSACWRSPASPWSSPPRRRWPGRSNTIRLMPS